MNVELRRSFYLFAATNNYILIIMKHDYEFTREIFNSCSNNQMRDVFFEELTLSDAEIDALIASYLTSSTAVCDRYVDAKGVITADIDVDGLRQKLTFCAV
jgi:hypothetical protein